MFLWRRSRLIHRGKLNDATNALCGNALEDMTMSGGRPSGSDGYSHWPVVIAGCVGAGSGLALAMLLGRLVDLHSLWLGMIMAGVGAGGGAALGQFAGRAMFRRPPE
jgi:hypothetical protein